MNPFLADSRKRRRSHSRPRIRLFPDVTWAPEEWRPADVHAHEEGRFVWYGRKGPYVQGATEVRVQPNGYLVCEYEDVHDLVEDPPARIRRTCALVTFAMLAQGLKEAGFRTGEEILSRDPEEWVRFAVDIGAMQLRYSGGAEGWVDRWP